jgi:hypothetical protein
VIELPRRIDILRATRNDEGDEHDPPERDHRTARSPNDGIRGSDSNALRCE